MCQPRIGSDPESSLSIQEYCVSALKGHTFGFTKAMCRQVGNVTNGRPWIGIPTSPERSVHILDHESRLPRQIEMSNNTFSLYAADSMEIADPKSPALGRQE